MTIAKNLILVGGGGHCKSVIEVAEGAGFNILGILDVAENLGKSVLGYKVVGTDDAIVEYVDKAHFIVTVGQIKNPDLRIRLHTRIEQAGGKFANLVASTAYVSEHSFIGEGTVIMHFAFVNSDVNIGKSCIINTYANIEHDVRIGDFCHISTGAIINGNCVVNSNCFIGSQSVLANGVSVFESSVVSLGSVVRKCIQQPGIYAGNPAVFKLKLKER